MSAMTSVPVSASAGGSTSGSFGAPSVTVSAARIAGPIGSGRSAERPLGRSIDTTGLPDAFTSSTTVASRPASGVESPVPNSASTIRSDSRICGRDRIQAPSSSISATSSAERAQTVEVGARVVPHVGRAADEPDADRYATLAQQPRDDEPVPAVVAFAAEDRDAPGREVRERRTPSRRPPRGRRVPSGRETARRRRSCGDRPRASGRCSGRA